MVASAPTPRPPAHLEDHTAPRLQTWPNGQSETARNMSQHATASIRCKSPPPRRPIVASNNFANTSPARVGMAIHLFPGGRSWFVQGEWFAPFLAEPCRGSGLITFSEAPESMGNASTSSLWICMTSCTSTWYSFLPEPLRSATVCSQIRNGLPATHH